MALGVLAYSNSFSAGVALDGASILRDPRIRELSAQNIHNILWHSYWWPNGEAGIYRPLTTFSILFNYAVLGNAENFAGYHWLNWLLHAMNVLLVFALARRLSGSFRISFLAAALWGVHPVLTEAVTNVAGRSDLMGAAAVLGGFLIYLRSADAAGARRIGWLTALALVSAAGVASKESAAILPGIIVLYEFTWRNKSRLYALVYGILASVLPIAAVLWQRLTVLRMSLPAEFPFVDNPVVGAGFWQGRLTALSVIGRYLWLVLWPARLSSDYSYSEIPLVNGGTVFDWIAWVALAIALAATLLAYRRNKIAFFFAGFAFLAMLPASNLLFASGTIMGERLLYLPSVGLVAILVLAVDRGSSRLPRAPVAAAAVFGFIVIAYGVRTWMRNLDWQDEHTMAIVSVQTSPASFKVHRQLATVLSQNNASQGRIDQAIAEADRSIAILRNVPDDRNTADAWTLAARLHLLKAEVKQTKPLDAHREYERAAQIALRSMEIETAGRAAYNRRHGTNVPPEASAAESYRILARASLSLDQPEVALEWAQRAKTIDPSNARTYGEIAEAEANVKRGEDAAVDLVEGMFVTSDPILREDLIELYQSGVDTAGCAVMSGPNGPALNPSCEIVRRNFCTAANRVRRLDVLKDLDCVSLRK